MILGQEACAEKSNELTAIPVLLEALLLKGAIVTILMLWAPTATSPMPSQARKGCAIIRAAVPTGLRFSSRQAWREGQRGRLLGVDRV